MKRNFSGSFLKSIFSKRRSRHIKSQMKFFGSSKFSNKVSESAWKFGNGVRDGRLGQFNFK